MAISIERGDFDLDHGYQYYVAFKPNLSMFDLQEETHRRVPVETSLCVSETGDLADFSFVLPKLCRSENALTFIRRQQEARIAPPEVFIALSGPSRDAVANAIASLDIDLAGRIIAMEIHWIPDVATS
jgi:hypothetical protein